LRCADFAAAVATRSPVIDSSTDSTAPASERGAARAFDGAQLVAFHMQSATDECQLNAVATVFYASPFSSVRIFLYVARAKAATVVTQGPGTEFET